MIYPGDIVALKNNVLYEHVNFPRARPRVLSSPGAFVISVSKADRNDQTLYVAYVMCQDVFGYIWFYEQKPLLTLARFDDETA